MKPAALTERFDDALRYAHELHREQVRKGSDLPYVSHLMAVASLVLEAGGDEDLAIAALLHDAAEDQGGEGVLEEIRSRFGERVAGVVGECSDTFETQKPPWRERKEAYLEHLREASDDALLVSLADKLHNARSILIDRCKVGEEVWERFRPDREGTLWYYRSLVQAFRERLGEDAPADRRCMVEELDRAVNRLEG